MPSDPRGHFDDPELPDLRVPHGPGLRLPGTDEKPVSYNYERWLKEHGLTKPWEEQPDAGDQPDGAA